ncbi:tetratricopeptide repeat protein [Magnetospira sp. QH-2]|uniref:tetratricopeptide repeat protein n=1 Tax=Magnetospira sp. (strain QH-2) TaxID=1288970 RepID=UPI0003E81481|nr:tetratricopeptide repeat protein [Magnetospira sp. QH-2]CCQ72339.1 Conserved Sel1-like TRP-containing protein of unknown function [Magnetospira sp. QH-2]
MTLFRFLPIVAILSVIHASTALSETLSKGLAAYDRKDYATAFPVLKEWAERGNPIAQFHFGALYDRGNGIAKDQEVAFEWFEKAAAQGHMDAQFNLALMLLNGRGAARDPDRAVALFRKVDRYGKGDFEARVYADIWEKYGAAFERWKPAADFLLQKAEAGDVWAQSLYARVDLQLHWNHDRHMEWIRKAAGNGSLADQYSLFIGGFLSGQWKENDETYETLVADLARAKHPGFALWMTYLTIEEKGIEEAITLSTNMLKELDPVYELERDARSLLLLKATNSFLMLWVGLTQGQGPKPLERILNAHWNLTLLDLNRDHKKYPLSGSTTCISPYLAHLYLYGIGVPQDPKEAHKFLFLSGDCEPSHPSDLVNFLDIDFERQKKDLAQFASPEVLREARIRAAQWWLETLRKP